jgi:glycosyltransferase involved in cell wall biosynthesis
MMACTLTGESNIEPPEYEAAGIPHFRLDVTRRSQYPLAILHLAQLLRREKVDILHTHHFDEAFIGVIAARLAGQCAPVIGRHYHDELYLAAKGTKLRALLAVESFCHRLARMIIVPSMAIRELLVRRQGVPAEKVRVVAYGFDFAAERYRVPTQAEALAIRQELGFENAFVIGNFGRHHPLKGQDYLLRAFADFVEEFPNARLLMVGDGPSHRSLSQLANALGVGREVLFTGWRRDVSRLLSTVDVVVHPTLHEALPQVMVESLAHRRPLIITDVSGAPEHVEDGRTGILVPRRDAGAICDALRWVATHPDEARQIGEEGQRYVLKKLDIRHVVRRYEAVYAEALGVRSASQVAPGCSRR